MTIKRVLLTGDDGYKSIGIRLLVHFLKNKYDLCIAATSTQQSATGGMANIIKGGKWGETKVEGIPVLWANGTPLDVIECAQSYYKKYFDLVISGINLGANIGGALMSSGTFAAAHRALNLNICQYAIAISWNVLPTYWFKNHDINEDLKPYLNYPGKIASKVIELAIKNKFWHGNFLNINLPYKKNNKIKFTQPILSLRDFYPYLINLNRTTHKFSYPKTKKAIKSKGNDLKFDSIAISNGYISISFCRQDMLDKEVYFKLKNKEIII